MQYTNPAAYPPLEHSSRILAEQGWDILFLGAAGDSTDAFAFPPHARISVRRLPSFGSGLLLRANYLVFFIWVVAVCLIWRPRWLYASDPMASLPTLAVGALVPCRVLYHEHDAPEQEHRPPLVRRLIAAARRRLARTADLCVIPQAQRLEAFLAETERHGPTLCVWNCPRLDEVAPRRSTSDANASIRFHYHGSINNLRLPLTVLDALGKTPKVSLTIVGYETIGSRGYVRELLAHAERIGITERVNYLGPLSRPDMMAAAGGADVGLALMPTTGTDINMTAMVGASNKAFDYMALGLMLLVTDLPAWQEMFVDPGYAHACDPSSTESLAAAMAWCAANPERVRQMCEAGRQRILAEWNFERQFEVVAAEIRHGCCDPAR